MDDSLLNPSRVEKGTVFYAVTKRFMMLLKVDQTQQPTPGSGLGFRDLACAAYPAQRHIYVKVDVRPQSPSAVVLGIVGS